MGQAISLADRVAQLEHRQKIYGEKIDELVSLNLDVLDALGDASTEEGMTAIISDMSTRAKVYWAVHRALKRGETPTGESIGVDLGCSVDDEAVQTFVEKIKAHPPARRPRGPGRKAIEAAQASPVAVVDAATLPPTPHVERSQQLPATQPDASDDLAAVGQMIILDDGDQSFLAMEGFIRFVGAVHQAGGIRKAAKYLRTMAEMQHTFAQGQ